MAPKQRPCGKLPVSKNTFMVAYKQKLNEKKLDVTNKVVKDMVDAYAETVGDLLKTRGNAILPNMGSISVKLRRPRSDEHKNSIHSLSGGSSFAPNPKYLVTGLRTKWWKHFKDWSTMIVDKHTWTGTLDPSQRSKAPVCKDGVSTAQKGSVVIGRDGKVGKVEKAPLQ